ncbi:PQQ-binding-like beta-propeller repeat protein [Streptomyces sp. NPDC001817]|uniref:outer membrane protein assembly factor BamB family protein n=1 Tax=Streptomyces sp. NPDC001817 TaxID=3154398 RepID=UPI00331D2025
MLEADRGRRRRKQLLLGGTALAVVLSCLAVWAWSALGGTPASDRRPTRALQAPDEVRRTVETAPAPPEGRAVFRYTKTIRQVGATVDASGAWATDRTFAKGYANHIQGIALMPVTKGQGTGRETLKLTFPGPLCAVTRHVSAAGWTAIAFPSRKSDQGGAVGRPCDRLALIDLDTGRELWQTELGSGDRPATGVNVTLTDGAVVVAWDQGAAAYDMTHGKRLWAHTEPSRCTDSGFAGGSALLALVRCGEGADSEFRVERIDARTGRTRWTYPVDRGITDAYLVSSRPAVLAVAAGDDLVTDLISSLDEHGRTRARMKLDPEHHTLACDQAFSAVVESCRTIVVGDSQAFLATDHGIGAFDLATGKHTKRFTSPTGGRMYPLKTSDGKLIAYREGGAFSPYAVVSLDPATGKETFLLLFGAEAEDLPSRRPPEARRRPPSAAGAPVQGHRAILVP